MVDPKTISSSSQRRGGIRTETAIATTASAVTAKVFELAGRRAVDPDDLALDATFREILESPLKALGYRLTDISLSRRGKSVRCTMADGEQPFCLMHLHQDLLPAEQGEWVHDYSYLGFYMKDAERPAHPLRIVCAGRETLPVEFDDYIETWKEFANLDVQFVAWSRVEALRAAQDPVEAVMFRLGLDFDVARVEAEPEPEQLGDVVELRPEGRPDADAAEQPGVFISYSHKDDAKWIGLVRDYLKPVQQRGFQVWDDSAIEPGDLWADLIATELEKARIVVLLVSQNFENSDFIQNEELGPALKNAVGGVRVFPVALSYVAHDQDPMKSLLMPYQWAYGPPTDELPGLDGLEEPDRIRVLVNLRRAIQTALESPDG